MIVVCPDTSPRGDDVPDDPDDWRFGKGAGFYLDATRAPYDRNYRMYSYVLEELPALIAEISRPTWAAKAYSAIPWAGMARSPWR